MVRNCSAIARSKGANLLVRKPLPPKPARRKYFLIFRHAVCLSIAEAAGRFCRRRRRRPPEAAEQDALASHAGRDRGCVGPRVLFLATRPD